VRTVVLSGGTGSAKFLMGLQPLCHYTVVANVGDNSWFHGLYVCPDIDTVTYALAGELDTERGWGVRGDTFNALERLRELGSRDTWFKIGDVDMATHVYRTALIEDGKTLTQATEAIARAYGVRDWRILPATDSHVETRIRTAEKGEMHLQEFWVREAGRLTPTTVRYAGARAARPTPQVERAVASADRVILCPANPITSIMPTLSIPGVREAIRRSKARKVAVSPMVGQGAYSGPAAKLMAAKGIRPTSLGVAELYRGLVDALVIDESDREMERSISKAGMECLVTSTLMRNRDSQVRLARVALEA